LIIAFNITKVLNIAILIIRVEIDEGILPPLLLEKTEKHRKRSK
jgi:hypothetical protein